MLCFVLCFFLFFVHLVSVCKVKAEVDVDYLESKMVKTNKADLAADEALSIEVYKYKCIYDKNSNEYREKDRTANAWKAIETELKLSEGM